MVNHIVSSFYLFLFENLLRITQFEKISGNAVQNWGNKNRTRRHVMI